MASLEALPLSARLGNAFVSYMTYMVKMLWPTNLAVFYPHPKWRPLAGPGCRTPYRHHSWFSRGQRNAPMWQ